MSRISNAVAQRQGNLTALIDKMRPQIARALPRHMDPDRLARVAMTVLRQTPQLGQCTPESFLGALMTCAQLGLEPGPLGHAYLVPYGREVTFVPGYRGLLELARRSGQIRTIAAHVVKQNDEFEFELGLEPKLVHRPALRDRGDTTHVYAVVHYRDGGYDMEVMSRDEVEAIRDRSKAGRSGPWVTDWDEMARKTVLRRLAKRMPMSVELAQAMAQDGRVRVNVDPSDLDVTPPISEELEEVDGEVVAESEQGDWPEPATPGGEA